MTILRFRDWSMRSKILSIFLGAIALVVLGLVGYFLPVVGDSLMAEKQIATKSVVDVAYSSVEYWADQAASGALTKEEAQKAAIVEITKSRYHGNEYFWINDMKPVVVAHGSNASLVGKNVGDVKDQDGIYLFGNLLKSVVRTAKALCIILGPRKELLSLYPRFLMLNCSSLGVGL